MLRQRTIATHVDVQPDESARAYIDELDFKLQEIKTEARESNIPLGGEFLASVHSHARAILLGVHCWSRGSGVDPSYELFLRDDGSISLVIQDTEHRCTNVFNPPSSKSSQ